MNNNKKSNEDFEGFQPLYDVPVTGAIVLKGKYGPLARFLNEMEKRGDFEVVYIRISPGRLYIVGEDGK